MTEIASERNINCLKKGKLSIGYLLAGYPEKENFLTVLSACEEAGLDIFEIGFPSENPAADGEVIRNAHAKTDLSIQRDLSYWQKVRGAVNAPIWIMGYKKDLIDTGFYQILAQNGLADAFVIPDAAHEERHRMLKELQPYGVDVLGFVTPDMEEKDQEACFRDFPLIYQQLYSGPTGMSVETPGYEKILERAKKHSHLHVFAGFGINSAERAGHLLGSGFDGVIVGTAMISKLNLSAEDLISFIKDLKDTVVKGR
jgi:tryptophan synthase alpha chain